MAGVSALCVLLTIFERNDDVVSCEACWVFYDGGQRVL